MNRALAALTTLLLPLLVGAAEPPSGWSDIMRRTDTAYAQVRKGQALRFPEDHGPHPAYALEWWYLTANLEDQIGQAWGLQWTLFRTRIHDGEGSGWQSPQLYLAHAALAGADGHRAVEKWSRGGIGQAGVERSPFTAWIDAWRWQSESEDPFPASLRFDVEGARIELQLERRGPYVLQGDAGYSVKTRNGDIASYYYSQPFLSIRGTIDRDDRQVQVTGAGWLDREWSSRFLDDAHVGWDWFSLHLDGGDKLMLFRVRARDGGHRLHGNWIRADGTGERLEGDQLSLEPIAATELEDSTYPVRWRLRIPSRGFDVTTEPLLEDQLMRLSMRYWEGAISISGSHHGRGFLEMTGY